MSPKKMQLSDYKKPQKYGETSSKLNIHLCSRVEVSSAGADDYNDT